MSLAALAREIGLPYSTARYRAILLMGRCLPVTGETLLGFRRKPPVRRRKPLPDGLLDRLEVAALPLGLDAAVRKFLYKRPYTKPTARL